VKPETVNENKTEAAQPAGKKALEPDFLDFESDPAKSAIKENQKRRRKTITAADASGRQRNN